MHFFGGMGTVFFLFGLVLTIKILWDKVDSIYFSKIPLSRDVTEQPIFFLALVAVVIGAQLFLTGFIAEMITMQSQSKREYLVREKIGF